MFKPGARLPLHMTMTPNVSIHKCACSSLIHEAPNPSLLIAKAIPTYLSWHENCEQKKTMKPATIDAKRI